jgi:hypothetical protein
MKESQKLLTSFVALLAICAVAAALLPRLGVTRETPTVRIQLSDLSRAQTVEVHDAAGRLALEVDVDDLRPESTFTVMLDGRLTGTLMTDADGAAELDRYGRAHVTSWHGAD